MYIFRHAVLILLTSVVLETTILPQQQPISSSSKTSNRRAVGADAHLTGVYRIDIANSDKLYSVIAGATSNIPFGEQQRFFIDLAARLTPPDLLAIEKRGRTINIASSRAPRITFEADGVTHTERDANGRIIRTSASLNGAQLTVNTSGRTHDRFIVTFDPVANGARLRVTRRIYAEELNQPITINSLYNRISEVAQWSIYGEQQTTATNNSESTTAPPVSTVTGNNEAEDLHRALNEWVSATNARDIDRLAGFYMPALKAYYLSRSITRSFVRRDKLSAFKEADVIEVQAEEPEIFLNHANGTAVMRFRKKYVTEGRSQRRSGEVIQELRWQKSEGRWKIISERDIRVIR